MIPLKLPGLTAAPFTPMHADGNIAPALVEQQASFLSQSGVSGAFINGTTGEGFSLSIRERLTLAQEWRRASRGILKLIIHVGHPSLPEARLLAADAQKIGADAFAAMPTSCFQPDSVDSLVRYCAEIASAAPELPFYYYHFPQLSRVNFKIHDFLEKAERAIPNLAGCKFTCEDLMDFGRCLEAGGGKFNMLLGRDEILLAGLALGAKGWVGSTYNLAAPLYLDLIEAFEEGDLPRARKRQHQAREMIQILADAGGLPAFKACSSLLGLDLGPVRLPLTRFPSDRLGSLRIALEKTGFFEFAAGRPVAA